MVDALFFNMFARLAWGMALSWVVFACYTGYASIVGDLLGSAAFMPLSKLSFATYLVHFHVIFVFHAQRNTVMHYDDYLMIYLFLGHVFISNCLAIVMTLLFEVPFGGLEKIIFGGGPPRPKS